MLKQFFVDVKNALTLSAARIYNESDANTSVNIHAEFINEKLRNGVLADDVAGMIAAKDANDEEAANRFCRGD